MSLATNVTNLATRVATEMKSVRTLVNGNATDLSSLTTTAKANLVAALNELKTDLTSLSGALSSYETSNDADISSIQGDISTINSTLVSLQNAIDTLDVSGQVNAIIDDTGTSASKVWSSTKTNSEITAAVAAVVDAAPASLDTLNELAAALGDDASFAATITALIGGKADAVHSHAISDVTGLQSALDSKASASALSTLTTNVGDTTTNYVTTFEAGLV